MSSLWLRLSWDGFEVAVQAGPDAIMSIRVCGEMAIYKAPGSCSCPVETYCEVTGG